MNKNWITGMGKEAKGTIKEAIGKATGDVALQGEGWVEKTTGKVQRIAGKGQKAVESTLKE